MERDSEDLGKEKRREFMNQLRDKIETIYHSLGLSKEEVTHYLNSPQNFSPEEWQYILQERERIQKELGITEGSLEAPPPFSTTQKKSRKSRGSALGGKNPWIPM